MLQRALTNRREVFFVAFAISAANALFSVIATSIHEYGLFEAILVSFKVSAIVWGALWLSLSTLLEPAVVHQPVNRKDYIVAGICIAASLAPISSATWVFVTLLSMYGILSCNQDKLLHRASWVMLALTVPMFWGRRVFNLFSDHILSVDASLVSMVTQTHRLGNMVEMPNGSGSLLIGAPCSSMANVSLAILCWTCFTQYYGVQWRIQNIGWCILAVVSVMAVNVGRIALIGFFPSYYEFLHNGGGVEIFAWLSALACFGVSYFGVRHARVS